MHVRSAVLVAVPLALCACEKPGPGAATTTSAAPSAPAPPASSAAEPGFVAAARAMRVAAEAFAGTCRLVDEGKTWVINLERSEAVPHYDKCEPTEKHHAEVRAAWEALKAYKSKPQTGLGASFYEESRLFVEWLEIKVPLIAWRGTLWHYQDLARAWNAWMPSETVPLEPPSAHAKTPFDAGAGPWKWKLCSDGACVVQP
jgi:hypothetical protein